MCIKKINWQRYDAAQKEAGGPVGKAGGRGIVRDGEKKKFTKKLRKCHRWWTNN